MEKIVDKQFELIEAPIRMKNIPEGGFVEVKGKEVEWWKVYKFETEEDYEAWKSWALELLGQFDDAEERFREIDLCWGMAYKYHKPTETKKGQLEIF